MPIFGVRNLMLNQYLGSLNNNIEEIQYLESTNLRKGRVVQFGAISFCMEGPKRNSNI